jgi:hypothetical protein
MEQAKMTCQYPMQSKLEQITRKWWFFLIFVLTLLILPPYASKGYQFPQEWSKVVMQALGYSILWSIPQWWPVFKIVPIILIVSVALLPKKTTRIFNIYVATSYILFAAGSIGITRKYGTAICTVNLIWFLVVGALWLWDAVILQNDFSHRKQPFWKYWVVPLALLAFWYPVNLRTGQPDFNPVYIFFKSPAGLAFCLMTPVYVGLLTLYYPKVNIVTLRATSLVGLFIGIANMFTNFLMRPNTNWWNGVLHFPLLTISLYGLIISLKQPQILKKSEKNAQTD